MNIEEYYIKKKSNIQIAKDKIMEDIMKQQGLYDMYFLGELSAVEMLINYVDKDTCFALLVQIIKSDETSENIKKLANDLIKKYENEPKLEP